MCYNVYNIKGGSILKSKGDKMRLIRKNKLGIMAVILLLLVSWKLYDQVIYLVEAKAYTEKEQQVNMTPLNAVEPTLEPTQVPVDVKIASMRCSNLVSKTFQIKEGKKKSAMISFEPTNATNQILKWSSKDKKIATVDANGVVTAKKVGTTNITATTLDGSNIKIVIKVSVYTKKRITYKEGFYYEPISNGVKKRIYGKSYKKNKNINYSDLRYVKVKFVNFSGKTKTGELIVNKAIAKDMVEIFYQLYKAKYPIEKMVLVDNYGADDEKSMTANNTSAFNYRVIEGTGTLSQHAYGLAIDINPVQNPYVSTRRGKLYYSPKNSKKYVKRSLDLEGMIAKDDLCYQLFEAHGFVWGGEIWKAKDYQHFHKVLDRH